MILLKAVAAHKRRRTRGEAGLSLMEVLVSLVILSVVMGSVTLFFGNGLNAASGISQRQSAVALADQALEGVQALNPTVLIAGRSKVLVQALWATDSPQVLTAGDDLTSGADYDASASTAVPSATPSCSNPVAGVAVQTICTQTVSGTTYTVRTFIDVCWLAPGSGTGGSGTCTATNSAGLEQIYRVTVDVSWLPGSATTCAGAGGACDFSASTLIDPNANPTFGSTLSTPAITGVSPSSVLAGATKTLTITGTGFVTGATVGIAAGGGSVGAITSITATVITVSYTAGSTAGSYALSVVNPDGGRVVTSLTVTPPPVITSISPVRCQLTQSTQGVTIYGTGFQSGATFTMNTGSSGGGFSQAGSVSDPNDAFGIIYFNTASTPSATITITNPDGGTSSGTVTNLRCIPTLVSVTSPASSFTRSAATVFTFKGYNFPAGTTVSFATSIGSIGPLATTYLGQDFNGGTDNITYTLNTTSFPTGVLNGTFTFTRPAFSGSPALSGSYAYQFTLS